MKQATLKNINMKPEDFHRACQIGIATRIARRQKLKDYDFDNMPIEEIEKFVNENS